jgi:hypothetical protein
MRPGGVRRAAQWDGWIAVGTGEDGTSMELTAARFGALAEVFANERMRLGRAGEPYEIAVLGYAGDKSSTITHDFAGAGATWWLESLSPMRGSVDELEAIVRRGPPS